MGTGARWQTIRRPVTQRVCCPPVNTELAFRPLSQGAARLALTARRVELPNKALPLGLCFCAV